MHGDGTVYESFTRPHGITVGRQDAQAGEGNFEGLLEILLCLVDISDVAVKGVEVLADGVLQLGEGETCSVRVVGWC